MIGALTGLATLAVVVALGYLLAVVRLVDEGAQVLLSRLAFFVAMPCLMFTVMASTPVSHVLSRSLAATAAGILLAALPYIVVARLRWRRRADEIVIGAMCSAYTNAGNLGLPVAAYVLGDASLIAPMLMLHLVVLQPVAIVVLTAGQDTAGATWVRTVAAALTNPLTLATFLGVIVSATGVTLPAVVIAPVDLVGGLAVPAVLIAYGSSLRLGPLPGRGAPAAELALVCVLKLAAQPLGAYLVGWALGLQGSALLVLAVTAALPCAQNIFVLATRFGRAQLLARDATFITTIGTVPVILAVTALLA